jgi:hypothetical protein
VDQHRRLQIGAFAEQNRSARVAQRNFAATQLDKLLRHNSSGQTV